MIAQVDDLVLMYRAGKGAALIKDIWKIVGPFKTYGKRNAEGRWPGLQAGLSLVGRLKKPLTYAELAEDKLMRRLGIVRKRFIGKTDITKDWPSFYKKIVGKNPAAKQLLIKYVGL